MAKKKSEKKPEKQVKYNYLTPMEYVEGAEVYIDALAEAISQKDVTNIAVTGYYGSGKSSVIKTFETSDSGKKHKFINVSLASFGKIETNKEKQQKSVEIGILEQLFVQNKKKSWWRKSIDFIWKKFNGIVVFLYIVSLLFIIQYLKNVGFRYEKIDNITGSPIVLIICFGIVAILSMIWIIPTVIRIFRRLTARISKINISNVEAELKDVKAVKDGKDKEIENPLDKNIDNIISFFEVNKYDVLILEDLDRHGNVEIYTQLREINLLLDKSKKITQKITFIYAMRDDVFDDQADRAKFFDFILPIVPVVNSMSSKEYFTELLKAKYLINVNEKGPDGEATEDRVPKERNPHRKITKKFINNISLYLYDMRLMRNIVNEFMIYKERIHVPQDKKKASYTINYDHLMAMIIYKNLYPKDFSELHANRGIVKNIFDCTPNIRTIIKEDKSIASEEKKDLEKMHLEDLLRYYRKQRLLDKLREKNIIFANTEKTNAHKEEDDSMLSKDKKLARDIQQETNIMYFLLAQGYISEDYHYYISLFDAGNITYDDSIFLKTVGERRALAFNYSLREVENITNILSANEDWEQVGVLNINLFQYLMRDKLSSDKNIKTGLFNLYEKSTNTFHEFIREYLIKGKHTEEFITFYEACRKHIEETKGNKTEEYDFYVGLLTHSNIKQEQKEQLLKKIDYQFSGIAELPQELWDIVMKYIRVLPCWNNVYGYYVNSEKKVSATLRDYLNEKEVYDILSTKQLKITKDNELEMKLFSDAILHSDISVDSFDVYTKHWWYYYDFFGTSNLDIEKVEIMINNDFLRVNTGQIKNMQAHQQSLVKILIRKRFDDFLETVEKEKYKLNNNELKEILGFEQGCDGRIIRTYQEQILRNDELLSRLKEKYVPQEHWDEFYLRFLDCGILYNNELTKEYKIALREKFDYHISDIGTLPLKLWDTALQYFWIIPHWNNVRKYYDEKGKTINKTLCNYLSKEEVYNILSTTEPKITQDNELEVKIFSNAVLYSDISIESFKAYAQNWWYTYTTFDVSKMDIEKVEIMINNDLLRVNARQIKNIREHHPTLVTRLIRKRFDEFLNTVKKSRYTLHDEELKTVLGWKQGYDKRILSTYQNQIEQNLEQWWRDFDRPVKYAIIGHMISSMKKEKERVNFLFEYIETEVKEDSIVDTRDIMINLLPHVNDDYTKILDETRKNKITLNIDEVDTRILDFLKEIFKCKVYKNSKIVVSSKRKNDGVNFTKKIKGFLGRNTR